MPKICAIALTLICLLAASANAPGIDSYGDRESVAAIVPIGNETAHDAPPPAATSADAMIAHAVDHAAWTPPLLNAAALEQRDESIGDGAAVHADESRALRIALASHPRGGFGSRSGGRSPASGPAGSGGANTGGANTGGTDTPQGSNDAGGLGAGGAEMPAGNGAGTTAPAGGAENSGGSDPSNTGSAPQAQQPANGSDADQPGSAAPPAGVSPHAPNPSDETSPDQDAPPPSGSPAPSDPAATPPATPGATNPSGETPSDHGSTPPSGSPAPSDPDVTPPAGPGPAGPGHEPTEGSSPPDTWYPPLDERDDSLPVVTVPEPSSLGLLGVGILALLAGRRRSARSRNR